MNNFFQIVSPSGAEDDCFIQSIDAESYSVRFMPRENGIHNVHIKFNGVHIPGSPFRIKVGKEDADPAAVHAHGNGLGEVKTGKNNILFIFFINELIRSVFRYSIIHDWASSILAPFSEKIFPFKFLHAEEKQVSLHKSVYSWMYLKLAEIGKILKNKSFILTLKFNSFYSHIKPK